MCRALLVLCAAPGRERLIELQRAATGAEWELARGAGSLEELGERLRARPPHVVVLDAALGSAAVAVVRGAFPGARIIALGELAGVDAWVREAGEVRDAVTGTPAPGGPVRVPRPP